MQINLKILCDKIAPSTRLIWRKCDNGRNDCRSIVAPLWGQSNKLINFVYERLKSKIFNISWIDITGKLEIWQLRIMVWTACNLHTKEYNNETAIAVLSTKSHFTKFTIWIFIQIKIAMRWMMTFEASDYSFAVDNIYGEILFIANSNVALLSRPYGFNRSFLADYITNTIG